jgi:5-methylcytosine-specific restriction endonuclease McrA
MPNCQRCGVSGTPDLWGRYRNGRLKVLCPRCDDQEQAARERTQTAKRAGCLSWGNTPEFKRLQREAAAAKAGRALPPYVPQSERDFRGRMRGAEKTADQIRARWAAEWLRPFRLEQELYQNDPGFRDQAKAQSRNYYRRHRPREVARVGRYKLTNPERNRDWNRKRTERLSESSDGTATNGSIARLKRRAQHCAYCASPLSEKQTDHIIPVALGGEHSLRNIVIVCPPCNGRKATLSYAEWIDRIEPQHRARVAALYGERYPECTAAAA